MLKKNTRLSLAIIFIAYLVWLSNHWQEFGQPPDPPSDTFTMKEMSGTWTDPAGSKDNCLSFAWTKDKKSEDFLGAALLSSGQIKDLFGCKDMPITFGFRHHRPDVQIFMTGPAGKTGLASADLKAIDHNHLRIQIISAAQSKQAEPAWLEPSAPLILVRTKEPLFAPKW
jgi:hypothetical protein